MNKERLLNVAKALRESPNPGKFDMGAYVHPCGTPACAFGHYAARSDLQSQFTQHGTSKFWEGIDVIGGQENVSYADPVVLDHFGITESQADRIFSDADYVHEWLEETDEALPGSFLALSAKTANEAAEWIERFVAEHE